MDVTLLGTGSPLPDPTRAGPATLVRAGGQVLLFDCGRGVLMRLAGAGVLPVGISTVLLTHLHSDHVTDLNDVITMRWAMSPTPNPLRIVGPPGTARLVERTLAMLADDIGYRLAHHADLNWDPPCEVTEATGGVVLDVGGVRVTGAPTDHAPVHPTIGYRIEAEGRSVVIAGDTVPCEGLDGLCAGADVYVQTVVRRSSVESIPVPRLQDILDYHSSVEQAADTAARAEVGTLVLTHLVPAPAPGTEQEWIDEAAAIFDGQILLGHDLLTVAT
jgi:ribonuclease Z